MDPPITATPASPSSGVPLFPAKTTSALDPPKLTSSFDDPAETSSVYSYLIPSEIPQSPESSSPVDPSVKQSFDVPDPSSAMPSETPVLDSISGVAATPNQQTNNLVSFDAGSSITQVGLPPSFESLSTYTVNDPAPQESLVPAVHVLTLGSSIITADAASVFVWGSQTLTPGGIVFIDGTSLSLPPMKSLVFGGNSAVLPDPSSESLGAFTFAGQTYTQNTASNYIINGQTLAPGQQVTVSGTPISLDPTPSAVTIAGNTQIVSNVIIPDNSNEVQQPTFTFAGQTFTEITQSGIVIVDGQTLTPGGEAVTISGFPIISLAATPTDVVVVGSSTQGIGGLIMSGFGGSPAQNVTAFTGGGGFKADPPIPGLPRYWVVAVLINLCLLFYLD